MSETKGLSKEELEQKRKENEIKAQLKVLKASYDMYERALKETEEVRKTAKTPDGQLKYSPESTESMLEMIRTMQQDIADKFLSLGGTEEQLKAKVRRSDMRKQILEKLQKAETEDYKKPVIPEDRVSFDEPIDFNENVKDEDIASVPQKESVSKKIMEQLYDEASEPIQKHEVRKIGNSTNYDTIKLPSKGECYKSKKGDIAVSYLTAYDENLILSPNLYRNGTFIEHILKNKIMEDIDPNDLVEGDRDAIIIWLRASGYGNEYPIDVVDEKGNSFRTTIDLSEIKFRPFTLKGDENGYFDFQLPNSKDIVKFKFLTYKDVKKIEKLNKLEDKNAKLTAFFENIKEIRDIIDDEDLFNEKTYEKISQATDLIEDEVKNVLEKQPETYFSQNMTNRLIMSTVSINGNTDRQYIIDYILNLNVKDAVAYRKYILDNEPGIDYNVKVEKPSSLGGGYVETFLQLDQFIFVTGV